MLTSTNPDAEHTVPGGNMAPEGEGKLALNPQLAEEFLEVLYVPYFSRGWQRGRVCLTPSVRKPWAPSIFLLRGPSYE